ncbi:MAG: MBL fold metallo-hydrolase [Xanthomonadales bacterium]|nr:MBL fold metallo-hydrolase [Xanthomonadales bacterium]
MSVTVKEFFEPQTNTFAYVVSDDASGKAAIIDPVWLYSHACGNTRQDFAKQLLEYSRAKELDIEWIIETHAHADHLTAAAWLRQETGAKIGIGKGVTEVQKTFKILYDLEPDFAVDGSQFDHLFSDNETFMLGETEVTALHTPGHTNDSMTYVFAGNAFIGDTLFMPDYGSARCDFPGGSAGTLFDSIQRIHALPQETKLYMCHDYPPQGRGPECVTTVAISRETNKHTRTGISREDFITMREKRDAQLGMPKLIWPSLQVNIRAGEPPAAAANGATYLKAPFNLDIAGLLESAKTK